MRQSRVIRHHLVSLLFFAGLAFLILHAILFHTGTHVAGFDYFNYNWNMWWIRHALTTPGLNVYENNFVFFPEMSNYGYHALTAFWFPLWALLEPLTGTLAAMNVILFIGCFLNGYLLSLWLQRGGVAIKLALIGGAALQATPLIRYFYYNTHINLMDWFWLPAHLMLWDQTVAQAEKRRTVPALLWALAQGVGLWGLLLTDLQFPIFVTFLLAPYGLFTLWHSRERLRLALAGLLTTFTAAALMWFAGPLPYILRFSGTLAPGAVEDRPGIPFPRGYLAVDPVWWHWDVPTLGGFVTISLLFTLALPLLPALRQKLRGAQPIRWLWLLLGLPPLLFSMGPDIMLFGVEIPMPFRLLYAQTNGMFGMPWRLAPLYLIAALMFIGLTWTPLLRPIRRDVQLWALCAVLLALTASVRLFQTAPLQPILPAYTFYERMGQERGDPYDDYVVVEVPTAVGTGEILVGDSRAISHQFYGMTHGKRMINGFISRAPVESFWYIRADDPLLSWLGQRRFLEPEQVEAQLRERIDAYPIGYIVVHQDVIGQTTVANQEIIGYFNSLDDLLCPVWREGAAVVYRTRWHPDGCPPRTPPEIEPGVYQIDIGAAGDEFFTGWGWHWQEDVGGVSVRWTGRWEAAQLYLDLPPADYDMTLVAQAFHQPRTLTVAVNGQHMDSVTIDPTGLQTVVFALPAAVLGDGDPVQIDLIYDGMLSAAEVGLSDSTRPLALMIDQIRFVSR